MATDAPLVSLDRADANQLALRAVRSVLDAAVPLNLVVEGTAVDVQITRVPAAQWPAHGFKGLVESSDGPLPRAVRARCSWTTGSVDLEISASWWRTNGRYRHLFGLRVGIVSSKQEILWTTVAQALRDQPDGADTPIAMQFSLFKRKDEASDGGLELQGLALKTAVDRSGLPRLSPFRVEAFAIRVPAGTVLPSPSEGFRRLLQLALLKLPFFVRGDQTGINGAAPFNVDELIQNVELGPAADVEPSETQHAAPDGRRNGIWPLPGGVRKYKQTLDELLLELQQRPYSEDELFELLKEGYDITGGKARGGYTSILLSLGVAHLQDDRFHLAPLGEKYLRSNTPEALFRILIAAYTGLLETLTIASVFGSADTENTTEILPALLGTDWVTKNQPSFRRNWLLSLGLTERIDNRDGLTDLGRKVLAENAVEVAKIRKEIDDIMIARAPDESEPDDVDEDAGPTIDLLAGAVVATSVSPTPNEQPSAWDADRLDLEPKRAAKHTVGMELPALLLEQACAALSAGKHLLLVGPPGTGKTELAHALAEAARSEGYCAGPFVATASADWTTFDTIGGYALQKDSSLAFRSGVFLKAIERWQWLILDELNRADIDRAFGELMTVLAGRGTDTPLLRDDGKHVSIGPELARTHRVPRTFRVIATMNTWDKTSLFRLSYAVQRRFAVMHVSVPGDDAYGRLLDTHATQKGLDPALAEDALPRLRALFSTKGLLEHRAIGPAVALDMIRYLRRRQASGDALAEAFAMYLLPQLEGMEQGPASETLKLLRQSLEGWTSAVAISTVSQRYREIFPHLTFSGDE